MYMFVDIYQCWTLQQVMAEAEEAAFAVGQATQEAEKARQEAEQAEARNETLEAKLETLQLEVEAAKASEDWAFAQVGCMHTMYMT